MTIFVTKKAVAELAFRLGELDTEVRKLKTANKHLELEWEELYDKVRRQMSRMSKRYAVDARETTPPDDPEAAAETGNRMDPISAGILRRRASNGAQS